MKAEIYLTAGDFPAAEKVLLEAKAISPRNSATLGRLAGVYVMLKKTDDFDSVVKFVTSFDSKPGEFYYELGNVLEDRKQYAKAEEYYKKSYELRPVLSAPRTGLGMLYLRLGNEKDGRALLDEAFKADPFNIRVSNSRKVMAHLNEYGRISNRTLQNLFDVDLWRARDILADLQARRIIIKTSEAARGPSVEYGPGPSFPRKRKSRAVCNVSEDAIAPEDEGRLF